MFGNGGIYNSIKISLVGIFPANHQGVGNIGMANLLGSGNDIIDQGKLINLHVTKRFSLKREP